MDATCIVESCVNTVKYRGYCQGHYTRVMRLGDPNAHIPLRSRRTYPKSPESKFEACLPSERGEGCWEWQGGRSHYGILSINGRNVYAHRYAWERANGRPIPEGMVVRHTCDNKFCVNPVHLLIGTQAQNVVDAMERRLHAHGEQHGMHALTEAQVIEIKQHLREGKLSQRQIAALYPVVTTSAIEAISEGRTWKHVA